MTNRNMNSHDFLNILHVCGLRPMVSVYIFGKMGKVVPWHEFFHKTVNSFWLRMLLKCLCPLPFSYNFSRMVNLWKLILLSMGANQILILLISVEPKNRNPWSRVQKSLIIEIDYIVLISVVKGDFSQPLETIKNVKKTVKKSDWKCYLERNTLW